MKTCPYCAEEIQDAAIKCKHCGSMLDGSNSVEVETPGAEPTPTAKPAVTAKNNVTGIQVGGHDRA